MVLPATPFRLEREMLLPICGSLPALITTPAGADVRLLREPNLGGIIPDLLIGISQGLSWKAYRSTRMEAHVIALLERKNAISMNEISEALFMSSTDVHHTLGKLARAGVARSIRGTWRLSREHKSKRVEVVAVEVKLARWRDALRQATEYLQFADKSYVILDGNRINETSTIRETFERDGIGLLFQYGFSTVSSVGARSNRPLSSVARVQAVAKLFGSSSADARRLTWGSVLTGPTASSTPETH
jgi:DNA-binding Lrp family transcriptional regulator